MNRILRTASRYFIGLDLGQKRDYTAIAILDRALHTLEERNPVTFAHLTETTLVMRHAERIPLGTPYPEVIFRVTNIVENATQRPSDAGHRRNGTWRAGGRSSAAHQASSPPRAARSLSEKWYAMHLKTKLLA